VHAWINEREVHEVTLIHAAFDWYAPSCTTCARSKDFGLKVRSSAN